MLGWNNMLAVRNQYLAALFLFAFPFLCFAHGSAEMHIQVVLNNPSKLRAAGAWWK